MEDASLDHRERPSRLRLTLARRLTAALAAMAVLSTLLAVLVQDRALSRDLRRAAETRLGRAAHAAEQLLDDHLRALGERYRAVSGTPQLRATLELADAPTLGFFAEQLRSQQGAALVVLLDGKGAVQAQSGDAALLAAARSAKAPGLFAERGGLYATVAVPLETAGRRVGELRAVETIGAAALHRWSELCGAEIAIGPPANADPDRLVRRIRASEPLDAVVIASLSAERAALAAARGKLLVAGLLALLVALGACAWLARSVVRPIGAIQVAVDRVRAGDLAVRLHSARDDEIGDVARGVDQMLEEIRVSHGALDARVAELRRSQEHLAKAQELARVGSFDYDPARGEVQGSAEFWALLGLPEASKGAPLAEILERFHPEDRDAVSEAVASALESGMGAHLDHRVRLPDGAERFLHTQFQVVRRRSGAPARGHAPGRDRAPPRRGADPLPRLPRQPDRPRQPAALLRAPRARDRAGAAPRAGSSACCSSTSTTSSASTTRSATARATSSCARWRTGSCAACARPT